MNLLEMVAPRLYDWQTDEIIRRRERVAHADMRAELRYRWREACERPALQLSHGIMTPSNGMGPGRAPLVHSVALGSADGIIPPTFVVELRPGQIIDDLEDAGRELAAALCVHRLAFDLIDRGPYVRVTMIENDPHAGIVEAVDVMPGTIALGPDENGHPIRLRLADLPHVAVQGQTGAGKSTALYWLMRQIVGQPGVRLAGVDPSGIIFRPMPADPWRVSGLADLSRVVDTLRELCDELDRRNAAMPWDDDKLPCGVGCPDPWLLVVLEELPGLLAAITAAVDKRTAELCKLYISRLTAEGRKGGIRVVMAAQRFEAGGTAGATVRSNAGLRVSFRVENATAVGFLHDDAPPDVVAEHLRAAAGVALVSAPGHALRRTRFPVMAYREWAHYAASIYGVPAAA